MVERSQCLYSFALSYLSLHLVLSDSMIAPLQDTLACLFSNDGNLALVQGALGMYAPLLAALGLNSLICTRLLTSYWRTLAASDPSAHIHPEQAAIDKRRAKRIALMRSFFIASLVHVACMLPGTLTTSFRWDSRNPLLDLIFRPFFSVGYALCAVSQAEHFAYVILLLGFDSSCMYRK